MLYFTVESRKQAYYLRSKKHGCKKCIVEHRQGFSCQPCQSKDCGDIHEHGTLACPLKLALAKANNSAVTVVTTKQNDADSDAVNVLNINQEIDVFS